MCGTLNGKLAKINLKDNTIRTIESYAHSWEIQCLLYLNEKKFISCSSDASIKIWNYAL